MFTGLIEGLGRVEKIEKRAGMIKLSFSCALDSEPIGLGESIAVNGVCLTVVEAMPGGFAAECSPETLSKTTLGELKQRERVNLERALRLGDRLGGHLVTGHVDGVGRIEKCVRQGESLYLDIFTPQELCTQIVAKGSIAVDGISLTVNALRERLFSVTIVPYTASHTTLGSKKVGSRVNIETDLIGKYVARQTGPEAEKRLGLSMDFLEDEGFF